MLRLTVLPFSLIISMAAISNWSWAGDNNTQKTGLEVLYEQASGLRKALILLDKETGIKYFYFQYGIAHGQAMTKLEKPEKSSAGESEKAAKSGLTLQTQAGSVPVYGYGRESVISENARADDLGIKPQTQGESIPGQNRGIETLVSE